MMLSDVCLNICHVYLVGGRPTACFVQCLFNYPTASLLVMMMMMMMTGR